MKRTLIALLTFFVAHIAWSQGDTVRYMDPWYKFNPYDKELVYPGSISPWAWNASLQAGGSTQLQLYRWSPGDTIWGVAITMDTVTNNHLQAYTGKLPFRAVLYELSGWATDYTPSANLVDSIRLERFQQIKNCFFDYEWQPDTERVQPCVEFYFNQPHASFSQDTIFVGYTWHPTLDDSTIYRMRYGLIEEEDIGYPSAEGINHYVSGSTGFQPNVVLYIYGGQVLGYSDTYIVLWGGMFPIVKLRCSRPPVLTLEEHTDNSQRVSWTMGSDGGYQLSIGPYGSAPAEGEVVTVYGNEYTFDTEADSIYSAWVRRSCRYTTASYDTLVWGEWSHPVTFRTAVSGGGSDTLAIDGNLLVEEAVVTARKGCIAVQGLAQGEQAEVYDMKGCRVATVTADREVCVPVPAGVYMVRLLSRHGSSHRRVVVTR